MSLPTRRAIVAATACTELAVTLSTFEQKEMSLPGPSNAAHMIRTKRELGHYTILLLALA